LQAADSEIIGISASRRRSKNKRRRWGKNTKKRYKNQSLCI